MSSPTNQDNTPLGHSGDHPTITSHPINPYKKLKNIVLSKDNTSGSNISSSLLNSYLPINDSQPIQIATSQSWGDSLQSKNQKHTRLFFQNINGISTKDTCKWMSSLDWLNKNSVDIVGLSEPNINTTDKRTMHSYCSKINIYNERSYIKFATNNNPSESKYQPGGCLLLCTEQWRSRIIYQFQDERLWGRYVGFTFRQRNNVFLTVITAYRCVTRAYTTSGVRTCVQHQREGMKNWVFMTPYVNNA
jgi:hypothetical protein